MKKFASFLVVASVALSFTYCSSGSKMSQSSSNTAKGLKDYYKDYFLMGVAIRLL